MSDSLHRRAIRFSLDDPDLFNLPRVRREATDARARAKFKARHVEILPTLFPSLHETVKGTCEQLGIGDQMTAFISASEEIGAACIPDSANHPMVWLSSGVVKLLENEELRFVLGHEIGHWILGHHSYPNVNAETEEEVLARQNLARASEVSADRVGLLACQDCDVALRALVKTASGLPNWYLGSHIGDFVSQVKGMSVGPVPYEERLASHPPMPVRAKAVLWYSMSAEFSEWTGEKGGIDGTTVDGYVESDMASYLGKEYLEDKEEAFEEFCFWATADYLSADGALSQSEQSQLRKNFGRERASKLADMLSESSVPDAREMLREKREEARKKASVFSLKSLWEYAGRFEELAEHIREDIGLDGSGREL